MIQVNHIFYEYKNTKYYDYKGYIYFAGDYYGRNGLDSEVPVLGRMVTRKLDDLDSLLDDTFVPQPGDPIHVVPDCVYSIQDIRNNYVIKRGIDSGVCNVYSPIKFNSHSLCPNIVIILPNHKEIYVFENSWNDKWDKNRAIDEIKKQYENLTIFDYIAIDKQPIPLDYNKRFVNYLPLLLGTNTKPNISYKKLKFNSNELTLDVLQMFMATSNANWQDADAEKNHLVQYGILNQHNWRDYPATIGLLLYLTRYYSMQHDVSCHRSKYPKYVKEILNSYMHQDPGSQKDFLLAQQLMKAAIGLNKDEMYVNTSKLNEKLREMCVDQDVFNKYFSTVTRIKLTEYESRESDNTVSTAC